MTRDFEMKAHNPWKEAFFMLLLCEFAAVGVYYLNCSEILRDPGYTHVEAWAIAHPEMKATIAEVYNDDGYISQCEYAWLKRKIDAHREAEVDRKFRAMLDKLSEEIKVDE